MKRVLVLGSTFLMCGILIGCSSDSREGLIDDTITMIETAATDVGNIKSRVVDAVKKVNDGTEQKLNLNEALKAADQLKKFGEESQKIKRRIEQERAPLTEEERKSYVEKKRDKLKSAFDILLKRHVELNKALADAEQINHPSAKIEVEKLRDRFRDALSPFESLAR